MKIRDKNMKVPDHPFQVKDIEILRSWLNEVYADVEHEAGMEIPMWPVTPENLVAATNFLNEQYPQYTSLECTTNLSKALSFLTLVATPEFFVECQVCISLKPDFYGKNYVWWASLAPYHNSEAAYASGCGHSVAMAMYLLALAVLAHKDDLEWQGEGHATFRQWMPEPQEKG